MEYLARILTVLSRNPRGVDIMGANKATSTNSTAWGLCARFSETMT